MAVVKEPVKSVASREKAREAIAAARGILQGPRREIRRRDAGAVSLLSDVGHGDCACEVCCGKRSRARWLRDRFPVVGNT